MNNKAFTLIEVLVGFVVASILVITIGTISHISTQEYNKTRRQAQLYNDVSYGFQLVRNRVRQSSVPPRIQDPIGHWKSPCLRIGDAAFGLYQALDGFPQLVFAEDWTDESTHTTILTDEDGQVNLDLNDDANGFFTVGLSGEKDNIQLTGLQAKIMRRVQ